MEWSFIDDLVLLVISIAVAIVVLVVLLIGIYLWVKRQGELVDQEAEEEPQEAGLVDDRQRL